VGTFFEAHAPAAAPLREVVLRNISAASAKTAMVATHVTGLRVENVTVGGKRLDAP
jgi:hypothetical protein